MPRLLLMSFRNGFSSSTPNYIEPFIFFSLTLIASNYRFLKYLRKKNTWLWLLLMSYFGTIHLLWFEAPIDADSVKIRKEEFFETFITASAVGTGSQQKKGLEAFTDCLIGKDENQPFDPVQAGTRGLQSVRWSASFPVFCAWLCDGRCHCGRWCAGAIHWP